MRDSSSIVTVHSACVWVCVSVHPFTGALLSGNMRRCCEPLHGYYDNSTGLSVSLQSHSLRRLDLFSLWGQLEGRGTGEGRGRERKVTYTQLVHDQDTLVRQELAPHLHAPSPPGVCGYIWRWSCVSTPPSLCAQWVSQCTKGVQKTSMQWTHSLSTPLGLSNKTPKLSYHYPNLSCRKEGL